MDNRSTMVALAATGISVFFAACGGAGGSVFGGGGTGGDAATASTGSDSGTGAGAGSGSDSSGTGFGTGSGFGDTGDGGASSGTLSSGAGDGAGGGTSCAGETSTAELVPLDLYIMLDASGSMEDRLPTRDTKWEAVTEALEAFFTDPQSAGLGVGLQYFPLRDPDVPATCTSNEECGAHGPCKLRICRNDPRLRYCATDADCMRGDSCVALGVCSRSGNLCTDLGESCYRGGMCEAVTESECQSPLSCDAEVYAAPAVDITPLDAAKAEELMASIAAQDPDDGTPTAGALAGAIERARAHALANPTHRVIAVLATDGMPSLCDPQDGDGIAEIASAGLNGSPSISTFVIGVFDGNDDGAEATMNRIAEGGGTQAFFIDTNTDVSSAFLEALNEIRGKSLACEYQVPTPSAGQSLDYGTLNVQHTPPDGGAPATIFYVGDEASCDAVAGGWYYDVDPATGSKPTKIVMCPATCSQFGKGGQVELKVGCKTEVPPVR
ncbi:hypothetical protein WMF31_12585 [Sorangium sp. So ce1036]|uniref:hypothetical protein n=1 Tax=Sorangium sp. So ce1036 TaxID=3133328 RepID=UPI003F0CCEA7